MNVRHIVLACAVLGSLVGPVRAEDRVPGAEWDHASAGEFGWSQTGLAQARAFSDEIRSSAVFIVHHGKVVAEWGDTTKRTELASVRKSLLSALIGIAVSDHLINLDSTLGELGIDDNPPSLTEVEKGATVRQLLQARSGVYHETLYETPGMAKARPPRYSHAPGTFWYYNNWDFNALGTIYQRATGTGIFDAFNTKIAKPTGMQDYRPQDGEYVRGDASIHPAYPIRMSARDLARFALLYLHNGNWAGRQIVPEAWVQASTRAYSRSAFGLGYGYLWWIGFIGDAVAPVSYTHLDVYKRPGLFEIGIRPGLRLSVVDRLHRRRRRTQRYLARRQLHGRRGRRPVRFGRARARPRCDPSGRPRHADPRTFDAQHRTAVLADLEGGGI